MQKVHTHSDNSAEQEKGKTVNTNPVPVTHPKQTEKIKEADRKFFERLKKLAAPIVVGFLLMFVGFDEQNKVPQSGMNNILTDLTTGDDTFTVTEVKKEEKIVTPSQAELSVKKPASPNLEKIPAKHSINKFIPSSDFNNNNGCNYISFFLEKDKILTSEYESPVYSGLNLLIDSLINICNQANSQLKVFDLSNTKSHTTIQFAQDNEPFKQPSGYPSKLTLITFELKKLIEVSKKEGLTRHPEHTMQLELMIRGIDAASGTQLFEERLIKERTLPEWANFRTVEIEYEGSAQCEPTLTPAMRQLIASSAKDIITIINKYLP